MAIKKSINNVAGCKSLIKYICSNQHKRQHPDFKICKATTVFTNGAKTPCCGIRMQVKTELATTCKECVAAKVKKEEADRKVKADKAAAERALRVQKQETLNKAMDKQKEEAERLAAGKKREEANRVPKAPLAVRIARQVAGGPDTRTGPIKSIPMRDNSKVSGNPPAESVLKSLKAWEKKPNTRTQELRTTRRLENDLYSKLKERPQASAKTAEWVTGQSRVHDDYDDDRSESSMNSKKTKGSGRKGQNSASDAGYDDARPRNSGSATRNPSGRRSRQQEMHQDGDHQEGDEISEQSSTGSQRTKSSRIKSSTKGKSVRSASQARSTRSDEKYDDDFEDQMGSSQASSMRSGGSRQQIYDFEDDIGSQISGQPHNEVGSESGRSRRSTKTVSSTRRKTSRQGGVQSSSYQSAQVGSDDEDDESEISDLRSQYSGTSRRSDSRASETSGRRSESASSKSSHPIRNSRGRRSPSIKSRSTKSSRGRNRGDTAQFTAEYQERAREEPQMHQELNAVTGALVGQDFFEHVDTGFQYREYDLYENANAEYSGYGMDDPTMNNRKQYPETPVYRQVQAMAPDYWQRPTTAGDAYYRDQYGNLVSGFDLRNPEYNE